MIHSFPPADNSILYFDLDDTTTSDYFFFSIARRSKPCPPSWATTWWQYAQRHLKHNPMAKARVVGNLQIH